MANEDGKQAAAPSLENLDFIRYGFNEADGRKRAASDGVDCAVLPDGRILLIIDPNAERTVKADGMYAMVASTHGWGTKVPGTNLEIALNAGFKKQGAEALQVKAAKARAKADTLTEAAKRA